MEGFTVEVGMVVAVNVADGVGVAGTTVADGAGGVGERVAGVAVAGGGVMVGGVQAARGSASQTPQKADFYPWNSWLHFTSSQRPDIIRKGLTNILYRCRILYITEYSKKDTTL